MNDEEDNSRTNDKKVKNKINIPKYKKWNLYSESPSKTSSRIKTVWKNKKGDKNKLKHNKKRYFSINSRKDDSNNNDNDKEKNIKFNFSIKNDKPILNALEKKIPKEIEVSVKDKNGNLLKSVNKTTPKKIDKKILYWEIGCLLYTSPSPRDQA